MPMGSLAEPVSIPRLGSRSLHYLVTRVSRQYQFEAMESSYNTIQKECKFFLPDKNNKIVTAWSDLLFTHLLFPSLKKHKGH
jgi:hypothetical protein